MGLFSKPKIPDPNAAAVAGAVADMENFPRTAQINALAKMGGKGWIEGKYYDFTGLGEADTAGVMSDKLAATLLELQQQFGPEFVKQRLAELKAADPTGYAARQQLFDRIMADADARPDRPMNEALQAEVKAALAQGGRLDARQREEVQQNVRGRQVGRGIFLGNAPASEEANAMVRAGEAMRDQRQNQAQGILGSGVLPDDVEYRRIQQAMANLGAFTSGQNPTAQFGQLSGNGAAPYMPGSANQAALNPNATAQGMQDAMSLYTGQVNWANSQMNPWLAGISGATAGANIAIKAGWGTN
jgi:hypothetical protein